MDDVFTVRYKISIHVLFTLILYYQWLSSVQLPTIFATDGHQPTTFLEPCEYKPSVLYRQDVMLCCQVNSSRHSECTTYSPGDTEPYPRWQHCHESLKSCSTIPRISKLNHLNKCHTVAVVATVVCHHIHIFTILITTIKLI
jgi:hypothetical protein